MLEASFLNLSGRCPADGEVSVRPAWEVREEGGVTSWFEIRMAFADGARLDALAAVYEGGGASIEELRARPALSPDDLTVLAEWIEGPLLAACGAGTGAPTGRRARPAWPPGTEGRRLVAQEYRAARDRGADPVLAVMCATGHGRRRSLRLIGEARDAGFLAPRRARR